MFTPNLRQGPRRAWRIYGLGADSGAFDPNPVTTMTSFVLWLLVFAVGLYLAVAMLRPDKF